MSQHWLFLAAGFAVLAGAAWLLVRELSSPAVLLGEFVRGQPGGPEEKNRVVFGIGQIVLLGIFVKATFSGEPGLTDEALMALVGGGLSAGYLGMKSFSSMIGRG